MGQGPTGVETADVTLMTSDLRVSKCSIKKRWRVIHV
jgi:hypothetical protein